MKIHQFVHTLSYGDAISNEAISISRLLRSIGIESHIYSVHAHEKLKSEVRLWNLFQEDLEESKSKNEEVAVILHFSIGSPLNDIYLKETGFKRALIYHNLTPEAWFFGYNPRVVADLRKGRTELPELLKSVDVALADSEFNKNELLEFGCKNAAVLPLLIDEKKWSIPRNNGIYNILKSKRGVNILHVGRFAPNKCLHDIIKAFYFYHHKIQKNSKLWLIGSDIDTEIYSFELRLLINELRLKDFVEIVGTVADSELKAFYEAADVYLCMSEHEGFCVPIIEAMHFGLPVIAFNSSAVGDTVADGGILFNEKKFAEIAELINIIVTDNNLKSNLVAQGKERVKFFSEQHFVSRINKTLVEPIQSLFKEHSSTKIGQC